MSLMHKKSKAGSAAQQLRYRYTNFLETLPVKKNTVFYHAYRTRIMAGNPFAIFQELMHREEFADWEHYWVYSDESQLEYDTFQRYAAYENVHYVKKFSDEHLKAMAACQYLVNNAALPDYWQKREGQIYINTWHGTPLKMLGRDAKDASETAIANAQRNFFMCDYMVMPNRYTIEHMLDSYDLTNMLTGTIVDAGYPRNDLSVNTEAARIRALLEKKLGLPLDGKKIVLYAPTFRSRKGKSLNTSEETAGYIQEMVRRFPEDYVVVFKVHNTLGAFFKKNAEISNRLIFDEIETNELLSATDVLITDYSSIFFDFLCTGRPCLFFVYDREEYESERGLYLSIDDLPGAICYSVDDLVRQIVKIKDGTYDQDEKYQKNVQQYAYNDDGHASERIVDIVFAGKSEQYERYFLHSAPRKKQLLINAGDCRRASNIETLYYVLDNHDFSGYEVSVAAQNVHFLSKSLHRNYPQVHLLMSRPHFNLTKSEELQGKIEAERQMNKFFGSLRFDKFIDIETMPNNTSRLFFGFPSIPKTAYWCRDLYAEAAIKKNGEHFEEVYLLGENANGEMPDYQAGITCLSANTLRKSSGARMNILFLSAFDSMNYVFTELILELRQRGHRVNVVVQDEFDAINTKMYKANDIEFIPIEEFNPAALNFIDVVISAPIRLKKYAALLNAIKHRNILLCSFSSLFSSVVMRIPADIVFCIGEAKIEEFRANYLRYNFIVAGNPQYDGLARQRRLPRASHDVKKVLIIDQGGYPYGAKGKQQLADTITDIAVNNPDIQFEIKPRYLKEEVGNTAHNVSEYLVDYFDALPANLSFLTKPAVLEDIMPSYDAMICTWSTAYMDALVLNIPLLLLSGFDSNDVFDVRTQRVAEAYDHLKKTGVLYDYHEVLGRPIQWHTVDPAYVQKEIYHADKPSAPAVIDFLEDCKSRLVLTGKRFEDLIAYTVDDYYQHVDDIRFAAVNDRENEARRIYFTTFNQAMQEYVYRNRCMGSVLDLSPLERMYDKKDYYAEYERTGFVEKEYRTLLHKRFFTLFNLIQEKYFTSPEGQKNVREDRIDQDFYFDWLYHTEQYDALRRFQGPLLAEGSREYYYALYEKTVKHHTKKAYHHLFRFFDSMYDNEKGIQLLKEKRIKQSLAPFTRGRINKVRFYRALVKNHQLRILDYYNESGLARNAIMTYYHMQDLNQRGEYQRVIVIYERFNGLYQKQRRRRHRKIRTKADMALKRIYYKKILRELSAAKAQLADNRENN